MGGSKRAARRGPACPTLFNRRHTIRGRAVLQWPRRSSPSHVFDSFQCNRSSDVAVEQQLSGITCGTSRRGRAAVRDKHGILTVSGDVPRDSLVQLTRGGVDTIGPPRTGGRLAERCPRFPQGTGHVRERMQPTHPITTRRGCGIHGLQAFARWRAARSEQPWQGIVGVRHDGSRGSRLPRPFQFRNGVFRIPVRRTGATGTGLFGAGRCQWCGTR